MEEKSGSLGAQEERDLKKFLKFLSQKAVQVIVQSRLGEKIHTKSKPTAMGQDWFNLAINDNPDVTSEVKKVMINGRLPSKDSAMCVEISLKSRDGESMLLETWCLSMNDRIDPNAKVTYTVYNRIGVLLKSLTSVTRVTPAYQLSRKQGTDFILCYRVYFGEVRFQDLGEGFATLRVGSIGTPVGSITLSAAYRTKLTLPEKQQVMVQSNHFSSELAQMLSDQQDDALPCGAFDLTAEARHQIAEEIASATETEVTRPTTASSDTPPSTAHKLSSTTPPLGLRRISQEVNSTGKHEMSGPGSYSQPTGCAKMRTKGAFVSSSGSPENSLLTNLSSTPPFASLLRKEADNIPSGLPASDSNLKKSPSILHRRDSSSDRTDGSKPSTLQSPPFPSQLVWDDDFVMVELKPAFASHSATSTGDLGSFFRECQTAPPLSLFQDNEVSSLDNIMDRLDGELCSFRENAFKFDELLAELQQR